MFPVTWSKMKKTNGRSKRMAAAGGRVGDLPVSEQLSREVLCLPLYPELPFEAITRIADAMRVRE